MKCPPTDQIDANLVTLKRSIGDDSRIIILDQMMQRIAVLGFIACCDVYVSPHRSEGFGRTIAEALLLNRPVIATAYSGNLDFTNSETAYLVNGTIIDVKAGEYPLWENQKWCDPDINELAFTMRRCREHPDEAALKAKAGKALLLERFSPSSVGNQYRMFFNKHLGVAF